MRHFGRKHSRRSRRSFGSKTRKTKSHSSKTKSRSSKTKSRSLTSKSMKKSMMPKIKSIIIKKTGNKITTKVKVGSKWVSHKKLSKTLKHKFGSFGSGMNSSLSDAMGPYPSSS